jgi:hypothetical protein
MTALLRNWSMQERDYPCFPLPYEGDLIGIAATEQGSTYGNKLLPTIQLRVPCSVIKIPGFSRR